MAGEQAKVGDILRKISETPELRQRFTTGTAAEKDAVIDEAIALIPADPSTLSEVNRLAIRTQSFQTIRDAVELEDGGHPLIHVGFPF